MTGPVLNEERLDRYQPLGAFGQPVYQNHVQLTAALRQRLGARHADFFAVPRLDEGNGRVTWISPVAGEARRWSDLDEAEQASRALDLQVMKSEFQTYLDELKAYDDAPDSPRGAKAFVAVLEQALRTPDDSHLFFVGDQPVSTFWGFREEDVPPFETLGARPQTAGASVTAVAPARNLRWLWWLLPLLLLLLLFLLWWFWPDEPGVTGFDDKPVAEETLTDIPKDEEPLVPLDRQRDRTGVIVDQDGTVVTGDGVPVDADAVGAEGQVEGVVPESGVPGQEALPEGTDPAAPEGQNAPETAEPPATEADNAPEASEPSAPEGGQPPEPAEPPAPEAGDTPEPPAPEAGAPPAIPEGAADGAAGFMQGQWVSDSGLVDSRSGQKLTQEYKFDDKGQGETIVRREDGVTCRAPATATVKGGNLEVEEQTNLNCSDGSTFARSRTVCTTGAGGKAECIGTDTDGDRFKVDLNRGTQ